MYPVITIQPTEYLDKTYSIICIMYVQMSVAILFLIANTIAALVPYANASSESPYSSGYNHGCDDAKISDPDDRYINQPEKGPNFHTNARVQ